MLTTPICALILLIIPLLSGQKFSPCPSIFAYEPRGAELDKWYGSLTVSNPEELRGIWLRIQLDERAELLGNWFGDTSSNDNREFLIRNRDYHYRPNHDPLAVRFFVKFDTKKATPSVSGIILNGRQVCQSKPEATESTTPRLFISNRGNGSTSSNNHYPRKTTTTSTEAIFHEEDLFVSELSASRRPPVVPSHTNNNRIPVGCGTVRLGPRPLITHGQATQQNEWPWHVALYRYNGINIQYICGGSLVSSSHVLTAAHCVTHARTGATIRPETFVVYLGKHNLFQLGVSVQNLQLTGIISHPDYNATYFRNDIAVLKLERDVEITDSVRPICLWEGDNSLSNIVDSLGTVVGWGFDETGQVSENLMQARMPIVTTETCIYSNPDFFSRFTSQNTYCAGFRNGTSVCTGDSGGGMSFPRSGTGGQNTVWQIRGIVSLSSALQNERVICDTTNYIVFTDVAKHLDWIKESMTSLN